VIDWSLAARVAQQAQCPVVLSGGLNPENIADAVWQVQPAALDTASGVESAPGIKDTAKMRDLVSAVRRG
jgi:phosphoribosylanthranilate isomerase